MKFFGREETKKARNRREWEGELRIRNDFKIQSLLLNTFSAEQRINLGASLGGGRIAGERGDGGRIHRRSCRD